ncbi:HNH endonuclease [Spongiimicrobium sp. 2-473A-2-J]|uniref:HNH endonuclease n=1 Tax=Eudoraea algarum TaxID=3417568 RepID=UPI003D35A23D
MATWLVLHKKHSGYGDVVGETYVYPKGIPNSRQIRVNDFIVFCLTKKSASDDKRILGYGRINNIELKPPLESDIRKRERYAAHLVDYKKFDPALSFNDIGGDPRTNSTNSISKIDIRFDEFSTKKVDSITDDDFKDKQLYARTIRKGQPKFREELLRLYEFGCAICGHGPDNVLEACHIVPHSVSGNNQIDNGLLLRSDLHDLFDDGLLKINPKTYMIELNPSLSKTPYARFDGKMLRTRKDGGWPRQDYLRARYKG